MTCQQAQHHFLAVDRGQRRDTYVELVAIAVVEDAPVLREPFLGDVEVRENLDLVHQRRVLTPIHDIAFGQFAVDTKAYTAAFLIGFDVDVAGVVAERLADERQQETPSRSDVGKARCRRLAGEGSRRIRAVILCLQALQFPFGNGLDGDPPPVEHLQLLGCTCIIMAGNAVTAYLAPPAGAGHEPVFGRLGGSQQLDHLGRNRTGQFHSPAVLHATYTASVSAINPARGMVAGRLTPHHTSAARLAASRKRT